jgi:hypothetical protein
MSEQSDYAELLRRTLEAKSSRRKLSFALAKRTGNQQASEYRSLGKYLSGEELPTRERGAVLAVLLDEPLLALVPDAKERRRHRQEALAREAAEYREALQMVLEVSVLLAGEVARLGGTIPEETLDALRQAVAGRQP